MACKRQRDGTATALQTIKMYESYQAQVYYERYTVDYLDGLQRHKGQPDGSSKDAESVAEGRGGCKLDVPACPKQPFRDTRDDTPDI